MESYRAKEGMMGKESLPQKIPKMMIFWILSNLPPPSLNDYA